MKKLILFLSIILLYSCTPSLSKLQQKVKTEDLSLLSLEQLEDRDVLNIMYKWEKTGKKQSWEEYFDSYYECDLCGQLVNKTCYCYKYR